MTHGFDLSSPLVVQSIIGDGCGGDRIFFLKDATLYAYDGVSDTSLALKDGFFDVKKIEKKGCIIFLYKDNEVVEFDLSSI